MTHNRLFYSTVGQYIMKHFRDEVYFKPIRIMVFPTFSIYQKHPPLVNMEAVINKPKIHDKSIDSLKESLGKKNRWIFRYIKEGKI